MRNSVVGPDAGCQCESEKAATRAALEPHYRATTYRCYVPGAVIDVRVDRAADWVVQAMDALLQQHGRRAWVFITAFNPGSRRRSAAENEAAQAELVARLQASGAVLFHGAGIADRAAHEPGGWPPEPSLLALGVEVDLAEGIAAAFGQCAVVVGALGQHPRLRWTGRGAQGASATSAA